MGVEVRLSDVSQLDDVLDIDSIDTVSLGSDGCPYKIPDVETLKSAHDRIVEGGKGFKVATPFVTSNHYDEMIKLVHALAEWDVSVPVVVNDYGLLHGGKDIWETGKVRPVVGMCLSYSHGQIVRGFDISDGDVETLTANRLPEDQIELFKWIIEAVSQNTMSCRMRVEFLKEKYNVLGAEIPLVKGVVQSLKSIRDLGLEVTGHPGRVAATMSRACPVARSFKQSPPACVERCNQVSTMTVCSIAPLAASERLAPDHEKKVLDAMPTYYVRGNIILCDGLDGPDCVEKDSLDHAVFDVRDQNVDELARRCETWKSSGNV